MTVVDENFTYKETIEISMNHMIPLHAVYYIDEHHAKSWNTRCIHDIWKHYVYKKHASENSKIQTLENRLFLFHFPPFYPPHRQINTKF